MPRPLLVGLGAFGLRAVLRARAWAARRRETWPVLVVVETEPAPDAAPAPHAAGVTRSLREFATLELPPRRQTAETAVLDPADVVVTPRATIDALRAALTTPPAWLPPAVAADPDGWLEALDATPALDRTVARLLWPRVEKAFAQAVARARADADGRAILVGSAADALGSGLVLDVADALARDLRLAACLVAPDGDAAPLVADLERRAAQGRPLPVVLLAGPLAPALLEAVAGGALVRAASPAPAFYRGRPLAFAAARTAKVGVSAPLAQWDLARAATARALERLLERRPAAAPETLAAAGDLFARLPPPAFAALAAKPLTELLRDVKPVNVGAADDAETARRKLDALYQRKSGEVLERAARWAEEAEEWREGGKLSLLAPGASHGFLPELERALAAAIARDGLEAGSQLLAAVAAELCARGAGTPRPQLSPKIADLDQRRAAFAPAARSGPVSLAALLGRKDAAADAERGRAFAEQAKLVAEIVRLREVEALLAAAGDLWDTALDAVRKADADVLGARTSAAAAHDAVAAADSVSELPAEVVNEMCRDAGLDPAALLARVLDAGAVRRWSSAPQAVLDELWAKALLPLAGATLLARLPEPGELLRDALERAPAPHDAEVLPRKLRAARDVRLRAPSEPLARAGSTHLPFPAETALDPGSDEMSVVCVEAGLPAFAFPAGAAATRRGGVLLRRLEAEVAASPGAADEVLARLTSEGPASGDAYERLLAATIGSRDLGALALAGGALASAEALRDDAATAPEREVLAGLGAVASELRKSAEVSDPSTRLHYLEAARRHLEAWAKEAADGLVEPERALAAVAAARFRELVGRQLDACRGRALLRLRLKTRRVGLVGPATQVEVEVVSCGAVAAEDVVVSLEPGEGHRVLGAGRISLGRLPAGAASVAAFQVKPLAHGQHALRFHARFADLVQAVNEVTLEDAVLVFEVRRGFQPIASNPYIAGPPVRTDRMFFGRDDVFAFLRDNLVGRFQSNVLVLHGNRRTGKSSILCQLEKGQVLPGHVPVYLDLQGLGKLTTGSFFAALVKRISRALAGRGFEPPEPPAREELEGDAGFEAMNEFVDGLGTLPVTPPPLLVLLDEFEILEDKARDGRVDLELFGWLRSLMQHAERLSFLLAGTHKLSELDPKVWSPLLSLALYRHVGFLAEADARALVTKPVEGEVDFDDLALEAILRLTAGHPYYVQLLCQLLVNRLNERAETNVVTLPDLAAVTDQVIDAGGGQFVYEWGSPRRDEGRLLLAALAEAAESAAVWVDAALLAERTGLDPDAAEEGARELVARDLVLGSGGAYRVRVDLFRLWLRREMPLARARAQLRGSRA